MKVHITISFVFLIICSMPCSAATIRVPADYPTIQEAVDACAAGDTIEVAAGTYCEHVVIDKKTLHIVGEHMDAVIIDAEDSGVGLHINESHYVSISDISIMNSGNDYEDAGLKISLSYYCTIQSCRIADNYIGLMLYGSSYNEIKWNFVCANYDGLYFCESSSVICPDNSGNLVQENIIEANASRGINFEHTGAVYHYRNVIRRNTIADNAVGIAMIMSKENEFCYNEISNNNGLGIALSMCMGGGEGNVYHHNMFNNNNGGSVQASDFGGGTDYWYHAGRKKGNYWSDYRGPDADKNGIGDIPYDIDGGESQDLYPLMDPPTMTVPAIPLHGLFILVVGLMVTVMIVGMKT